MIEISDCHSPSIVLRYNDTNEDTVEEILETCHSGNQFSFPHNDDNTRIGLSLYCIGGAESNDSMFGLLFIIRKHMTKSFRSFSFY